MMTKITRPLRHTITILIVCVVILIGVSGCGTTRSAAKSDDRSNLTMGVVKQKIVEGKTTQADILTTFGSPNLVTRNAKNEEVWNYTRMAYRKESGGRYGGFIFFGGSKAVSSSTSKSFDLILVFDKRINYFFEQNK